MTIPTPADAPLTLVDVRDWLAEYYPDTDVLRTVEAALGTGGICRCGMARSYHGPNPPDLADHEWEPRYLSPQPEVSVTPGLRASEVAWVKASAREVDLVPGGIFDIAHRAILALEAAALAESPVTPDLRAALADLTALMPADRWVLLRPATQAFLDRALASPDPEAPRYGRLSFGPHGASGVFPDTEARCAFTEPHGPHDVPGSDPFHCPGLGDTPDTEAER